MKKWAACRKNIAVVMLGVLMSLTGIPAVKADILILPPRIVFQSGDRMKGFTLVNNSDEAAAFEASLFYQRQAEDGSYVKIDPPTDPSMDLAKMISFSPKRIFLEPRSTQVVRLSLRRPPNFPDGEYRVHMRMLRRDRLPEGRQKKNVAMAVNVGFAIPVVVRQGRHDAKISMSDFEFVRGSLDNKNPPRLNLKVHRSGKHGAFGKIVLFWKPAGGGPEQKVGMADNVNIFSEIESRPAQIIIQEKNISGGQFRVVYEGRGVDKGIVFDEKVVPVGS